MLRCFHPTNPTSVSKKLDTSTSSLVFVSEDWRNLFSHHYRISVAAEIWVWSHNQCGAKTLFAFQHRPTIKHPNKYWDNAITSHSWITNMYNGFSMLDSDIWRSLPRNRPTSTLYKWRFYSRSREKKRILINLFLITWHYCVVSTLYAVTAKM